MTRNDFRDAAQVCAAFAVATPFIGGVCAGELALAIWCTDHGISAPVGFALNIGLLGLIFASGAALCWMLSRILTDEIDHQTRAGGGDERQSSPDGGE